MQDSATGSEDRVAGDTFLEAGVDEVFSCEVVDLEAGGGGDADFVVLAYKLRFTVSLGERDVWVGYVAGFGDDGFDGVEGCEEGFGFGRRAPVGEGPPDYGVCGGDGGVVLETAEVDGHVYGGGAVAVEVVEGGEDGVEMGAAPDVVMVVPEGGPATEDVEFEGCDDAEVVAGAFHAPEEIGVVG